MGLLKSSWAASILLISLFSLPSVGIAQLNSTPNSNDTDSETTDDIQEKEKECEKLSEMPVYNPESGAVIKIIRPPDDIEYNMPIAGMRDSSQVKTGQYDPEELYTCSSEEEDE